jgi:hypothetical protein
MYASMTQEEAERFILANDHDAIESKAYADTSLIAAAYSYGKVFKLNDQEMVEFAREMLGQTESTKVTDMINKAVSKIPETERDQLAVELSMDATEYVHDCWRVSNTDAFGKNIHQYANTNLIGLYEQSLYHRYILPVCDAIGLHADKEALAYESYARTADYIAAGVKEYGSLAEFIVAEHAKDEFLSEDIQKFFGDIDIVEAVIVPKLVEKGFGTDEPVMDTLDKLGVEIEVLSEREQLARLI